MKSFGRRSFGRQSTFTLLYFTVFLFLCWACEKSEIGAIPNRAPAFFSVKATPNGDGKSVKLTWTSAIDPDGDKVTYSVFAKDTLARNLSDTTFTLTNVGFNAILNGKIIAKDTKGLYSEALFYATTITTSTIKIPDVVFEQFLIEQYIDSDNKINGQIKFEDALKVKTLTMSLPDQPLSRKIQDLTGIEGFLNLEYLDCSYNKIASINISKNAALTNLFCSSNVLTALDVSKNTTLSLLSCEGNKLTVLDVNKNSELSSLNCTSNSIITLDVSKNPVLTELYCDNNNITFLDVTKNIALNVLSCSLRRLNALDVTQNTKLVHLYCSNNRITALDVTKNTALTALFCNSNNLTFLDISKNGVLKYFNSESNLSIKTICVKDVVAAIANENWHKDATSTYTICK
jgi:Leucine-rich repeat (LRR) protein